MFADSTRRLAEAHADHILGAHFNMLFAFPEDMAASDAWEGVTPAELEAFGAATSRVTDGTGYSDIQGSKPQTLAYGMHDSPVALLAWQLEKFHGWSHAELAEAYTKDQVLANVAPDGIALQPDGPVVLQFAEDLKQPFLYLNRRLRQSVHFTLQMPNTFLMNPIRTRQ